MDKFKEKTMYDYTSWDINCKYIGKNYKKRISKLKQKFKRKARRKLKQESRKEIDNEN